MDAQDLLGRKVDIVTVNSLHPLMRQMSTTAEKLWEATRTLPEPLLAEALG